MLTRIMAAAFGVILLNFCTCNGNFCGSHFISSIFSHRIRYFVKRQAEVILNRRMFDENFLMAVATIGAFALAVYSKKRRL